MLFELDFVGTVVEVSDVGDLRGGAAEEVETVVVSSGASLSDVRIMHRALPDAMLLVVIRETTRAEFAAAAAMEADGYLLEAGITVDHFAAVLRAIRLGQVPMPVELCQLLLRNNSSNASPPTLLTPREHDVLRLVASGASNKEIARILSVSIQAVKHRLTAVFDKLGCSNRTLAVVAAVRGGLIECPCSARPDLHNSEAPEIHLVAG